MKNGMKDVAFRYYDITQRRIKGTTYARSLWSFWTDLLPLVAVLGINCHYVLMTLQLRYLRDRN